MEVQRTFLCALFQDHLDCPFGTDGGADAATLAVV
jgi:hypothetical protein